MASMEMGSPDPSLDTIGNATAETDPVHSYSLSTGLMVLMLLIWISCGPKLAARYKYIGEGSAACMLGLLTGLGVLTMSRYLSQSTIRSLLTFNPADFFTYLLPPIIFYAGLSVKKKQFFRNFASITAYGVFGTYIAFFVIAFVLYGFSKLPNILNVSDCLALGVIFAATDSVAVLQVLKQDRTPLLYSLVFGEGVMNDATAVALLKAVQGLGPHVQLTRATVALIFFSFLYIFVASLVLGVAVGLGTAFLLKQLRSNSVSQEVALIGILSYLSYLAADVLDLSGIVSLFCCAAVTSHYALNNVSPLSRATTVAVFKTLSHLSEGAIFIYVGMDAFDPLKWQNTYFGEALWIICVLIFLLMLGRAAFVFPLSWLHNCYSREQLSGRDTVVIWWAGVMRGAVSVALVYYYFDPTGLSADSKRSTLIAATLVVVLASTLLFGGATQSLLDLMLGPQVAPEQDRPLLSSESHSGGSRIDKSGGGFGLANGTAAAGPHTPYANGRASAAATAASSPPQHTTLELAPWAGPETDPFDDTASLLASVVSPPTFSEDTQALEGKPDVASNGGSPPPTFSHAAGRSSAVGPSSSGHPPYRDIWMTAEASSPLLLPLRRQHPASARGPSGGTGLFDSPFQGATPAPSESGGLADGGSLMGTPLARDSGPGESSGSGTEGLRLLQREFSLPPGRLQNLWDQFDVRYMRPIFGGPQQPAGLLPDGDDAGAAGTAAASGPGALGGAGGGSTQSLGELAAEGGRPRGVVPSSSLDSLAAAAGVEPAVGLGAAGPSRQHARRGYTEF